MYGKHFEQMYTGSMFGSGPVIFAVWGYVISHTRPPDGHVELNPALLGAMIGCEVAEIEAAVEFLCSPDEHSRSKLEDGRRLVQDGEFSYQVVNYITYREIRKDTERRQYNREKQREWRAKKKAAEEVESSVTSLTVNDKSRSSGQAVGSKPEVFTDTTYPAEPNQKPPETPNGWRAIAAPALRAAAVPEEHIGDCLKNWWPKAVKFASHEELAEFLPWWANRRKDGKVPWNPAAVWNLGNDDGVERFKWALGLFWKRRREKAVPLGDIMKQAGVQ